MVVKSYLTYQHLETIGAVASPKCNIEVSPSQNVCFTGANESICVWDLREGTMTRKLTPSINHVESVPVFDTVCCLLFNKANPLQLLAAYSDGKIRLWDWQASKILATFDGHKGLINSLTMSMNGEWLASGGSDGDIILWDLLQHEGKLRLNAHQSSVTFISFLHPLSTSDNHSDDHPGDSETADSKYKTYKSRPHGLISTGVDGLIKYWDIETEMCQVVVSSHCTASIHTAYLLPDESELICGFANRNMEVFSLRAVEDLTKGARISITYSGNLERISGTKRCNSFTCIASQITVPASLLGRFPSGLISLANGILLSPHMDEFFVVDTQLAIFSTSFQKYAEVIIVEDYAGQKRRELRILARRIEKLKRKIAAIESNQKIDKELKSVLGKNWRSQQDDFETRQLKKIEKGIFLLRNLLSSKKNSGGPLEGSSGSKKKKRALTPDEEVDDEEEETEAAAILSQAANSSSVKMRLLPEKFDLTHKGIFASNGSNMIVFTTDQNSLEAYLLDVPELVRVTKTSEDLPFSLVERTTKNRRIMGLNQSLPHPATRLVVSFDDTMLVSLYTGGLTVWDVATMRIKCIYNVKDFKPLSAIFLAGNDHLIIGDLKGNIMLFNISSAEMLWTKSLSSTALVSISGNPDQTGFTVVDASKRLIVCALKLIKATSTIDIKIKRETELSDSPSCVQYSKDGRMLAVGLKDNTINLFYADTLKLHLTLYGHSLPVTSLDFSTDNQMLISGGLDRHLKVWDVEFGNILRSMPASRTGAVTDVRYIYDTHYVISSLSTGEVKLFDCDSGDRICTLQAGRAEINSLATTEDAELIFCASGDGSIKIWERTDKQLILSEEREKEENQRMLQETAASEINLPGAATREIIMANRASKKDAESVRDTERLIEVLTQATTENNNILGYKQSLEEWEKSPLKLSTQAPPKPVPLIELLGRTPVDHVLHALSTISSELLVETILGLPYIYAEQLLGFLIDFLEKFCGLLQDAKRRNLSPLLLGESELACRVALIIVHAHGRMFLATTENRDVLIKLNKFIKMSLDYEVAIMRRNQVALDFISGGELVVGMR